ncbi:hypothetical protein D3C81_1950380 [compost metagenome]
MRHGRRPVVTRCRLVVIARLGGYVIAVMAVITRRGIPVSGVVIGTIVTASLVVGHAGGCHQAQQGDQQNSIGHGGLLDR